MQAKTDVTERKWQRRAATSQIDHNQLDAHIYIAPKESAQSIAGSFAWAKISNLHIEIDMLKKRKKKISLNPDASHSCQSQVLADGSPLCSQWSQSV